MRTNLYRFSLVFARFVPVRRFAFGTNSRLSDSAMSGHPLMGTTGAFVSLLLDRNQSHVSNILAKNRLSRKISK